MVLIIKRQDKIVVARYRYLKPPCSLLPYCYRTVNATARYTLSPITLGDRPSPATGKLKINRLRYPVVVRVFITSKENTSFQKKLYALRDLRNAINPSWPTGKQRRNRYPLFGVYSRFIRESPYAYTR